MPLGEGPEMADIQHAICMVENCQAVATRTITVELPAEMFGMYLPPAVRQYDVVICSGLHPGAADFRIRPGDVSIAESGEQEGTPFLTGPPAGPDRYA